ncbi:hypothetical protein [Aeromonas bestiarum]|uniref:hypothetical protein n=1 Tax=Aeromonas bestiarum TaxID=105751 RepID=UPI0009B85309|nr:hypothetical protein [Aeromonas bestiarum]
MSDSNLTCFKTGLSALLDVDLWVQWTDIFSNLFTVSIAGLALYIAHRQLKLGWQQLMSNRTETRNATAHNLYHQYLKLCIDMPQYSYGMEKPNHECIEYGRYCWFISAMLFTFEQILETMACDEKWQTTIKSQLIIHKEFLSTSSTVREKKWNNNLQKLIEDVISVK